MSIKMIFNQQLNGTKTSNLQKGKLNQRINGGGEKTKSKNNLNQPKRPRKKSTHRRPRKPNEFADGMGKKPIARVHKGWTWNVHPEGVEAGAGLKAGRVCCCAVWVWKVFSFCFKARFLRSLRCSKWVFWGFSQRCSEHSKHIVPKELTASWLLQGQVGPPHNSLKNKQEKSTWQMWDWQRRQKEGAASILTIETKSIYPSWWYSFESFKGLKL